MNAIKALPKGEDGKYVQGQERYDYLLGQKPDNVPMEKWEKYIKPVGGTMTEYQARTLGERVRHDEATENKPPKPGEGTEMKTIYGPGGADQGSTGREGERIHPAEGMEPSKTPEAPGGETPEDKKAEKKTTAKNREVDRIDSVMKTDETLAAGNPGKMALVDKKKEYMSSLLNSGQVDTVEDVRSR